MDELSAAESRILLTDLDVAHIGVVTDDGDPYVTPISFVLDGNEIAFRTVPGRRLDAIRRHPNVCVEASRVDDLGNWESVVAWGSAFIVEDHDREAAIVAALLEKYHGTGETFFSFPTQAPAAEHVAVVVSITSISGRNSGRGVTQRTRPGRL